MLDWFSSKRKKRTADDSHPLGSPAAVRQYLAALPTLSPMPCLQALHEWLGHAETLAEALSPAAYRHAIAALDNHAQAFVLRLWDELFARDGGMADDRWNLLFVHYGHMCEAYRLALALYPPNAEMSGEERRQYQLFMLRAMRSLVLRHKLNRLRYRAPDSGFWQSAHGLYLKARQQSAAVSELRPYNEDEISSSVQGEFLRLLMLEASPLENLAAEQIECLDRLLRSALGKLVLRDTPNERTLFQFAPAGNGAPRRITPGQAPEPGSLCFGPWGAFLEVGKALADLDKGLVPEWLQDAPGDCADHIALLRTLRFAWSANPPSRRSRREEAAGTLLTVHGFIQVRRMIAASDFARSGRQIDFSTSYEFRAQVQEEYFGSVSGEPARPQATSEEEEEAAETLAPEEILERLELAGDREQMEHWTIVDRSDEGVGAIVPHQKKWLKVSTLIGFRLPDSIDWHIAILRRLGRTPQGRRLAGLQVMEGIPVPVYVRRVDKENPRSAVSLADFSDGILASRESDALLADLPEIAVGDVLLLLGANLRRTVVVAEIVEMLDGIARVAITAQAE